MKWCNIELVVMLNFYYINIKKELLAKNGAENQLEKKTLKVASHPKCDHSGEKNILLWRDRPYS